MQIQQTQHESPRGTTLLDLVQSFKNEDWTDDQVVSRAAEMVSCGEVELTGNFRGCRDLFARIHRENSHAAN